MISVLYVDDELDLLELARLFLEQSGEFHVQTSISARDMLDSPAIRSFDVIVSDYQMPGMDGIAFLKGVRERFGDIPFILFTGRGREEVVIEALNSGADFYIQKGGEPASQFAELANKITYAVSRRRAERELERKNNELKASYERIAANEEELRRQLDKLTEKQEALRVSEERFRAFTENVPDITTIVNTEGFYSYISPSVLRITGWKEEQLLGRRFREIDAVFGILPEDRDILLITARDAGQRPGETVQVPPFRIRDAGGVIHFIEGTYVYLPEVPGIQGYLFHGRDITDRILAEEELKKKNEELNASHEQIAANEEELRQQLDELTEKQEALRVSEEKFRAFTENITDLTTIVDITGVYRYISPSIRRMTGWDPDQLLGKKFQEIDSLFGIPPGDKLQLYENARLAMQRPGETIAVPPFRLSDSRGGIRYIEGTHTFLPNVPGIQGLVFHGRDVTDRILTEVELKKKNEELNASYEQITASEEELRDQYEELARSGKRLSESEEKYRHILENLQDAFMRSDRDGTIRMVNPSAVQIYRYDSPEEMIGMPAARLYSDPGLRENLMAQIDSRGKIADFKTTAMRKDGTTFPASISVQVIFDEAGKVDGIEGIVRDTTEQVSMEQAIREANGKLNLLSSITRHDIANQLTIQKGYVQLAGVRNTDPVVGDFLTKIEDATDRITRQIECARAYQELGIHSPAWFRLDNLITRTARHGVSVSRTCSDIEIFADPLIERVFYNLFENADKHGDHVTMITVSGERAPDGFVILVEDDGVGIAPEEKEKIFTKGYGRNTGFGLFLAREILAITGISIRETGYAGVGARFEITVPKDRWRVAGPVR